MILPGLLLPYLRPLLCVAGPDVYHAVRPLVPCPYVVVSVFFVFYLPLDFPLVVNGIWASVAWESYRLRSGIFAGVAGTGPLLATRIRHVSFSRLRSGLFLGIGLAVIGLPMNLVGALECRLLLGPLPLVLAQWPFAVATGETLRIPDAGCQEFRLGGRLRHW